MDGTKLKRRQRRRCRLSKHKQWACSQRTVQAGERQSEAVGTQHEGWRQRRARRRRDGESAGDWGFWEYKATAVLAAVEGEGGPEGRRGERIGEQKSPRGSKSAQEATERLSRSAGVAVSTPVRCGCTKSEGAAIAR